MERDWDIKMEEGFKDWKTEGMSKEGEIEEKMWNEDMNSI